MIDGSLFLDASLQTCGYFSSEFRAPLLLSETAMSSVGTVIFHIDFGRTLWTGFWAWTLLALLAFPIFRRIHSSQREGLLKDSELREAKALEQLASQVAHDIRSPLAALEMALKSLPELEESKRLLVRGSLSRIGDIANNLIQKKPIDHATSISQQIPNSHSQVTVLLISGLIEEILTEKRMQFRSRLGIEIDSLLTPTAYGIFAQLHPVEFKRMISNLLNNAVESLEDAGKVTISLSHQGDFAAISITDSGKGIPPEILSRLGQRGETHGKAGGSGLGLYHARTTAESWGGRLDIDSALGFGTTVTIKLPLAATPKWFVDKLRIATGSQVVFWMMTAAFIESGMGD